MWEFFREKCIWFYATFHNNETILYARMKAAVGAAWVALAGADMSHIIENPKYLGYWFIFDAFVTEMLRRSRAEFTGADDKDSK